jgi:hypothetical protein
MPGQAGENAKLCGPLSTVQLSIAGLTPALPETVWILFFIEEIDSNGYLTVL